MTATYEDNSLSSKLKDFLARKLEDKQINIKNER